MKPTLPVFAIASIMLCAPAVLSQPYESGAPRAAAPNSTPPAPTRAIPLRSDTDITVAMRADMTSLDGSMAKMRTQMTTINATTDIELRQKLMQEQLLKMQEHMNVMQKAMGHMADLQATAPPPDPPRAMPSH